MPAHRVRPARSPDRPPLHPTTLPGTGPHPTEPSGRYAPVASARSPSEPIGGRKNTNRETDATGHTANTPSASRSTAFPPRKRRCSRRKQQKAHAPPRPNCLPIRGKRPKTDRAGTSGCTASPPSVSQPTDFPPPRKRPCSKRGRQKRTLPPRPNCPPIRGKRPKTDRTATSGCTADASARSSAAAFFSPSPTGAGHDENGGE